MFTQCHAHIFFKKTSDWETKKTLLAFRFVFAVKLEVVLVLGGAVDVLVLDLEKSLLGKQILVIVQTWWRQAPGKRWRQNQGEQKFGACKRGVSTRLPDGTCIFVPKIPIWVNFGGSWSILRPFGIFIVIWNILCPFGILYVHLVYFSRFGIFY
jgi:hypothetical protein